jgi:CubicO group peptidase (beta-lactamase class C family)
MMRRGADMTLRPIRLVAVALVLGVFLAPAAPACRGQAAAPAVRATKAPAKTMRPVPATAPDLAQLDRDLAQALRDWQVPGMAVAIVKNGAVVHAKGYGVRELGKPGPVDANTLFAIASNSKAFTSAALAILADEGKITWDDRVVAHLPYFQAYDPWVTHEMRIRDLLSHRSGFGTFSGDLLWYGTPYSREEVIWRARFLHPETEFRAGYRYNNLMFVVAGEIVAKVTGQTWDAFVKQRIFDPLDMRDTVTSIGALQGRANAATPHGPTYGPPRPFPWYSWDAAAAAAGIISSAGDMAKWLVLQLGRGTAAGQAVFSDAASRQMWTPHVSHTVDRASAERFPSTHFRGYGLGWNLSDYRGRLVVEHGGAYDGMYSQVVLVPEEQLGLVVLTNSMTSIGSALKYVVVDRFLGGGDHDWSREFLERAKRREATHAQEAATVAAARLPDTKPSLPLADYAGTYPSDLYGKATVTLEGGALVLRLLPNPDLVADLSHWHLDTFHLKWRKDFPWFADGKAQFVLDPRARITEMKLDVPNEDFWFHEPRFMRKD